MHDQKPVPANIEKIMSVTRAEFEAGLVRLGIELPFAGGAEVFEATSPQGARITFEMLEPALLGGLMRLPRARIVLDLANLTSTDRQQFLNRFDQTFQRGGG